MGKWLKLADGAFLFGEGGINRFEENKDYTSNGVRSKYITSLFNGAYRITATTESIEELMEMLGDQNES